MLHVPWNADSCNANKVCVFKVYSLKVTVLVSTAREYGRQHVMPARQPVRLNEPMLWMKQSC